MTALSLLRKFALLALISSCAIPHAEAQTGGQSLFNCGATCTITTTMAGATINLNVAAGSVATLPAASGSGNTYRFVVTTTTTSAAHKVLAASTSDNLQGTQIGWTGSTAKVFGCLGNTHALQMPFAGTQPSGGFIGDTFLYRDVGVNLWQVDGVFQAGTTPTTPCSATNT